MSESPNYGMRQSAYRAFHSTATAMTKVVNDLLTADIHRFYCPWTLAQYSIRSTMIACLRIWSQSSSRQAEVIGLPVRSQHLPVIGRMSLFHCATQGSLLGSLLFSLFATPVERLISSFDISLTINMQTIPSFILSST